jgi:anaerobic selenocysteine-containing dehydrogenase
VVHVHPTDAATAGIEPEDEVVVTSAHFEKTWRAKIRAEQQQGTLHVVLGHGESINPNPDRVNIRKRDV